MILLPLEELLEKGLIKFERRIYCEEVRAMAEVADELGEETIKERHDKLVEGAKLGQNEFGAALMESKLSDDQREVMLDYAGGRPSFFERKGLYKKWKIEYSVDVEENLGSFREHADRLIKEGKVCFQDLSLKYDLLWIDITVNGIPSRPNTVDINAGNVAAFLEDEDEIHQEAADYLRSKMKEFLELKELHAKPFEPEKLYTAVMDFIKY